jgi:hypothetical protein
MVRLKGPIEASLTKWFLDVEWEVLRLEVPAISRLFIDY